MWRLLYCGIQTPKLFSDNNERHFLSSVVGYVLFSFADEWNINVLIGGGDQL